MKPLELGFTSTEPTATKVKKQIKAKVMHNIVMIVNVVITLSLSVILTIYKDIVQFGAVLYRWVSGASNIPRVTLKSIQLKLIQRNIGMYYIPVLTMPDKLRKDAITETERCEVLQEP